MRLVIQRVTHAEVVVDDKTVGQCGHGYMVLCGAEIGDTDADVEYCVQKTAYLRVFEDDNGKMNRSILDISGSILAISQFTLLGDARHGRRPSFDQAERPDAAKALYERYCEKLRALGIPVECGIFGADMKVSLTNDGPVTILMDSRKGF